MTTVSLYTVGGTVQAGDGLYIDRKADQDIFTLCQNGAFVYMLAARQMGKSSLMVRTAQRLAAEDVRTAILDLTELGVQGTAEAWYLGLIFRIGSRLGLKANVIEWWQMHIHLGVTQRLVMFFQEIMLAEVAEPLVIFIDEIDTTLSLDFTDDFFTALRYLYNARATTPHLHRLSFVLIGVATPSELISDPKRTPFNIGQRIDLTDFTMDEAAALAAGLFLPDEKAKQTMSWIMSWTQGHPYLTQRLCATIASQRLQPQTKADVDQVVADTFFGEQSERDTNLQFVHDMLTRRAPDVVAVLLLYRDILAGRRPIRDAEQSVIKAHLKLTGIVREEDNSLCVRNPIYARVFDRRWLQAQWPVSWWEILPREVKGVAAMSMILLLLLGFTTAFALREQERAQAAEAVAISKEEVAATREAEAIAAREEAERQRSQAVIMHANTLAAHANTVATRRLDLPMLLGLEIEEIVSANQISLSVDFSLRQMLDAHPHLDTYLHGHTERVRSIAFSPDGRIVASGGDADYILLWDVETGRRIGEELRGHSGDVESLTFSRDGTMLVSGSRDGMFRIWDVRDGHPVTAPNQDNGGRVWSVAFSPDGERLAVSGDDGAIRFWDITTGERIGDPLTGHGGTIRSIAFSPDGTLLAASAGVSIRLWDIRDDYQRLPVGEPWQGHEKEISSIVFHPDGQTLASGSYDGSVRLWDVTTGENRTLEVSESQEGHTGQVRSIAFSSDGAWLFSGGDDERLLAWDVAAGKLSKLQLSDHQSGVRSVATSSSGLVASGYDDGTVILWQIVPNLQGEADLQKRACGIANRNLTRDEWERYMYDKNYERRCDDIGESPNPNTEAPVEKKSDRGTGDGSGRGK